jgi:CheY-like chemotaxis protein
MPKALVIDDDPDILEAVSDILESLGHEYELANSVESARQCLESNEYSYVLLDLEIPVRAGRTLARIENGENLLQEIVERTGTQRTPTVIVMTAHGTDGPDLAVDVMKKGARDYVTKPFKTSGHRTLDKSIRAALATSTSVLPPARTTAELPRSPHTDVSSAKSQFAGGTMTFYTDRVELCGVAICDGSTRCRRQRKALDALRQRSNDGRLIALSSRKLEQIVGGGMGPNTVPGLIQTLRKRIIQELRSIGLECGRQDVIERTRQGYQFRDWITVQEGNGENASNDQGRGKANVPNQAKTDVPNGPDADDPIVSNDEAETSVTGSFSS